MKNETESAHMPKQLRDELKSLVSEAETLLSDALAEPSAEGVHDLRARFSTTRDRMADVYAGARKNVLAGAKYTDASIRENPYQAMVLALGVGALAGACAGVLFGRRSR